MFVFAVVLYCIVLYCISSRLILNFSALLNWGLFWKKGSQNEVGDLTNFPDLRIFIITFYTGSILHNEHATEE